MASLLSPRRTRAALRLQAADAGHAPEPSGVDEAPGPPIGWLVAAVACGLLTALAGWVLCAGVAVVGWLAAEPGTLADALGAGTRLWLLTNGIAAEIGARPVTLVPWGATAVVVYLLGWCAALAARRVRPGQLAGPLTVVGVLLLSYLLPVLVVGVLVGQPWRDPLHWAAVIVVLGLTAAWSAGRALGRRPSDGWPAWAQPLPRAVLGAQLVLLAGGAVLLLTGLVLHRDRVGALHAALDPGVGGGLALLLAQLALVPTAVVWAAAYALGAGFVLGPGSVVAPAATELGMLPALPLLGALPDAGPGSPWALAWLAWGALAGAVAAVVVVRARPGDRWDVASLAGGLAGVLAGLVFVALAWATGGDLGVDRLTGLGPRLGPLLVLAVATLGLAGLVTGLALGLTRARRDHPAP